ncbi:16S rRNA pseudouridine(516) synthase RsuA [Oceanospirillum sediminis]|uniref:Pseudouridine synthase n=1 Tax=Oceanospirillum sediminis TaxID=2760088 RepID=A0A839IR87_9GAMM|nr:16S rRNA pseudouridine(516) synthase RsuA [Oceanospirillum sediminis]MBB1487009.1 16S rRNA pseudouridine(516) synthase RsuA [Oceanospirillum sediminis]
MRLDKFICHHTGVSRAEAKRVMRQDKVLCNGQPIRDPGYKVSDDDEIELNDQILRQVRKRYLMLNKPADTVCSTIDEEYPSVINCLDVANTRGLHIAGRLDVDTTGLVLITDDGQWSHQITSPKKLCPKTYYVWLAEPLQQNAESLLAEGIMLHGEDEPTRPAQLARVPETNDTEVLITITEGKYHQVKRMFAALGNKVEALHREQIGDIALDDDLCEGEWRELTEDEVASVWDKG